MKKKFTEAQLVLRGAGHLPIYAQAPAANDTWTYSLTEKSGS